MDTPGPLGKMFFEVRGYTSFFHHRIMKGQGYIGLLWWRVAAGHYSRDTIWTPCTMKLTRMILIS
jgi:hypothetical protein